MDGNFDKTQWGARVDYPDLRDQYYSPALSALREEHLPPCDIFDDGTCLLRTGIRNQNADPTCVGHALASLIELQRRAQRPDLTEKVSANMLYQMSRFHASQGVVSSGGVRGLRSAIKAFYNHGVALSAPVNLGGWPDEAKLDEQSWPDTLQAAAAEDRALGAYYRLRPILSHYTAAIAETGGVLASARIHSGWLTDRLTEGRIRAENDGEDDRGIHAFVLLGYTREGFLVLNSWGERWGGYRLPLAGRESPAPGIGLWAYEDWARSIGDGWVLRLGVPGPSAFPVSVGEWGVPDDVLDPKRSGFGSVPYRELRGSFLNLEDGRAVECGAFATPAGAVEATIEVIVARIPESAGVVIHLPGVLATQREAFATAVQQRRHAERKGLIYLTCFWCADFAEEIVGIIDDIFRRCAAQVGASADVDDAFEVAARNAGRAFWRDIERHAQAAALPCGPGSDTWNDRHACEIDPARGRFGDAVERIDAACRNAGKPLHLTVDGAGVLVLDALLDRIAGNDPEKGPDAWLASVRSVGLALPAIPVERAEGRLLPFLNACHERRPGSARIFVPDHRTESRIGMHGYSRSILHLVQCSFLDGRPPMLGMAEATKMPRFAEIRESLVREFKIEGANRIQQTDLSRSSDLARLFGAMIDETEGDTGARTTPAAQQEEARPIMTDKISLEDLQQRMAEGSLTQDEMEKYLIVDAEGSTPFAPAFSINQESVEIPPEEGRSALALNALNEIERFRRKAEFYRRIASGDASPRIAAEGDSWFQFPLLLDDVIDVVGQAFPVYDTSAAGDLLENMAARREYIKSLRESGAEILLLSAGGNDLCAGGALATHLEAYDPNLKPADYLKRSYQAVLDNAIAWYERICRDVHANFPNVTIITHGYDYVIPDGGRWLGKPMEERGITDPALQRKIVVEMVDQLNRALRRMTQSLSRVAYVDCRGSVPSTGWFDELHPRNLGFSQVAERITHAIREIAGGRGIAPEGRTRAAPAAPALVNAEGEFRALHVGLNRIDPYHYAGWDGALRGCENDARAMSELAEASGFRSKILVNEDASREALSDGLRQAASGLKAGDFFLLTYSGHGGQIPDWNGDEEEIVGKRQPDSTLCLYDSQMIDDELFDLWTRFETGVRILFLPDSCHSGSVVRAVAPQPGLLQATSLADLRAAPMSRPVELLPRCMPSAKAAEVVAENESFYRERSRAFDHVNERLVMSPVKTPMKASLISLSACQDEETAFDGDDHGVFTAALLKTWDRGNFFGNYREFHRKIALEIGVSTQNPRLLELPPADPSFSRQRPFGGHRGADADRTQTATDAPPRKETGRSLDALLNGEGDEHDLPVPGARGPSGSRGAADQEAVSRFSSFMAGATSLKHFAPEEFLFLGNSHYGSGSAHGLNGYPPEELWPNIVKTAEVLDELRAKIGAPIRILSAYRNGAYNKAIGGENHSMHMQFRACDIAADGVPASKVAEAVLRLRAANGFKGGVGRYPGFTHVDTRGINADWVQNGSRAAPPAPLARESADPRADLVREYAEPNFALRGARRRRGRGELSEDGGLADLASAQGAVNGSGIVSFDREMPEETRRAVLYTTQFAQRAADARADAVKERLTWWTVYGSALRAVGWVTQGSQFRRIESDARAVSIDSLALDAISALLVGPSQLVALSAVLDSLRKAADGDRRIELLDLYSSAGGGGLFQLGAAQVEGPGVVTMALGAVQFSKLDQRKKIVFVSWGKEESKFWVAAERMTLNLDFYAGHAREAVEEKLLDAAELIQTFEVRQMAH